MQSSDLKITMEIASDSICFLDLKISIVNQWLVTAVYSRPTYLYFYLHRLSCHSKWNCLALYLNLDGRSIFTSTPLWFSFNNSETVKAVHLAFEALNYFLLEKFLSNMVSLTCPSLQILSNAQTGLFPISRYLVSPL